MYICMHICLPHRREEAKSSLYTIKEHYIESVLNFNSTGWGIKGG